MKKLNISKTQLTNYDYISNKAIKVKNHKNTVLYTNLVFSNRKKEQGVFIAQLSQPSEGFFVLLASLKETLRMNEFEYRLSVCKLGEEYKTSGLRYITHIETNPYPRIHYALGNIDLVKSFILDQQLNILFIEYELEEAPVKTTFEISPLLAFREINKLSFENENAKTEVKKATSGYAMRMYKEFPWLYFTSTHDLTFSPNGHWIKGFEYPMELAECEYEDLYIPGSLSFELSAGEKMTLAIGLDKIEKEQIRHEFINSINRIYN
jgi:predicted glycogen debranching enzyme